MPLGGTLMRSQVLYQAAQVCSVDCTAWVLPILVLKEHALQKTLVGQIVM